MRVHQRYRSVFYPLFFYETKTPFSGSQNPLLPTRIGGFSCCYTPIRPTHISDITIEWHIIDIM